MLKPKILPSIALFILLAGLNVASGQWVTHGPYGGFVESIAVKDSFVFAGTLGNGVFRSANKGLSWQHAVTGLPPYSQAQCIYVDGQSIYAGLNSAGVYRSTDNGSTWASANYGLPTQYMYTIKSRNSILMVGTSRGLYISDNNGQSWTCTDSLVLSSKFVQAIAFKGNDIFLGTNGGVFVSHDNANTFTLITNTIANPSITSLLVKDSFLFAGASGGLIYRSVDDGNSWVTASSGIPNGVFYMGSINEMGLLGDSIFAPQYGSGLFLSVDNGDTWTTVNTGLGNVAFNALFVSDSVIYAGTGMGGVWPVPSNAVGIVASTNNGISWNIRNEGINNCYASALLVKNNTVYAGIGGEGVFATTNNGNTWLSRSNGLGTNRVVFSLGSGNSKMFTGTHTGMFISADSANTWSPINNGFPTSSGGLCITVSDTNLFVGTISNGVMLSKNNGATWAQVNTGITGNYIYSLASIGTNIFAGTSSGVFRTTNNGTNWTAVNTGLSSTQIQIFATHDSTIYVGTYTGGLYMSNNFGTSWTRIDTLQNISALCVNDTGIFVANYLGYLYFSPDTGANWYLINDPRLPGAMNGVYSINFDTGGIYAGTATASVWQKSWASFLSPSQVTATATTVCFAHADTFTATVLNDSAPYYQWYKNGVRVGTNSATYINGNPANNDSVWVLINGATASNVVHVTVLPQLTSTVTTTICAGTAYAGHNTDGTYVDHYISVNGCDSTRTLNLSVSPAVTATVDAIICSSDNYAGHNTTGTYVDHYVSAAGCDSARTLNLTVRQSGSSITNLTICPSGLPYIWNGLTFNTSGTQTATGFINSAGCDSTATLNLTVNSTGAYTYSQTICPGTTYNFNGRILSLPGNYRDTLPGQNGCDSIVTLNLLTNDINTQTSVNGAVCTALQNNAGYQWINCANNQAITGATLQVFTASQPGNYACIITSNNCTDTTGCINITSVGINETAEVVFGLNPNPTNGVFTIHHNGNGPFNVVITDAIGSRIAEFKLNSPTQQFDISQYAAGFYHLSVLKDKQLLKTFRLVKQ